LRREFVTPGREERSESWNPVAGFSPGDFP
jgi:hypothetical protein